MVSNEWRNVKHAEVILTNVKHAEVTLTNNLPEASKENHKTLSQASRSLVKDLTLDLQTIKQSCDVLSCLIDEIQLLEKVPNYCYSRPWGQLNGR